MPSYDFSVKMVDAYNRTTTRRFSTSDDVIDFAAAGTLVSGFLTDLAAASELRILSYSVAEKTAYTDTVDASANKDEGATLRFRKQDNEVAIVRIPGPVGSMRNADGTIAIADAVTIALVANWLSTPGLTLSDGEVASEFIGGTLDV